MLGQTLARISSGIPSPVKLKLSGLRPLYGRLLHWREPVSEARTIAGQIRWRINAITSQRHVLGTYEPLMQEALAEFAKAGAVVYDVGAHAGYLSLTAALIVGDTGEVFAFEANPNNCNAIREQLALNPRLNVRLMPCALSDHDGTARFDASRESSMGGISDHGTITVETRTIDSLVDDGSIPSPDVIKIDVEGHEGRVLAGGVRTIASAHPIVLCDYNEGDTRADMEEILSPLGYTIHAGEAVIAALPPNLAAQFVRLREREL